VNASQVIPEQAKAAIAENVSKHASNIEFGGDEQSNTAALPVPLLNEITSISQQATVDANKETLLISVFFVISALLISVKLPNGKNIERGQSVAVVH
jgi:hypothetical protein